MLLVGVILGSGVLSIIILMFVFYKPIKNQTPSKPRAHTPFSNRLMYLCLGLMAFYMFFSLYFGEAVHGYIEGESFYFLRNGQAEEVSGAVWYISSLLKYLAPLSVLATLVSTVIEMRIRRRDEAE